MRFFRTLLLLAPLLLGMGCQPTHRYEVKGRIAGFSDDASRLFIEHEAIPGFMDAMTMPFAVADTTGLSVLELRDAVQFTLVVTRTRSWIEGVARLPNEAVAEYPAGRSSLTPSRNTFAEQLLAIGDHVPAFSLLSQDSTTVTQNDYADRPWLITFIYTRCPLPDYCPLMSRHFQQVQAALATAGDTETRLLTVSFDPTHDTPSTLRTYARRYTDDLTNWTFATGSESEIAKLTAPFGIFIQVAPEELIHNLITALVDAEGRVQHIWRGNDWTPDEVLTALSQRAPKTPTADVQ